MTILDLNSLTKEDLIRFILQKKLISEIGEQKKSGNIEIPVSIFKTKLFPLEAITRYLKENQNMKINEIAKHLGKNPSEISLAYKKAVLKKFDLEKTVLFIPLEEFEKNKDLSIMEILVEYLKTKNLKFTEIAKLLDRDVRTIWTSFNRGEKKQKKNIQILEKNKKGKK